MVLQLAAMGDLPQLLSMYREIVDQMMRSGLRIWDEVYPCQLIEEDIVQRRLYLASLEGEIAAAFALCEDSPAGAALGWAEAGARALYIDRLAVKRSYARQGVGSLMLHKAMALARQSGAQYLRLSVVDVNRPAIRLYEKNGWKRAGGVYEERIEGAALRQYGYEVALTG